jgi:integrase
MEDISRTGVAKGAKLLDRVRAAVRLRHYSIRTEESYVGWVRRFVLFHGKRHPSGMGAEEVVAFLSHLAVEGEVAASTQNQARAAILFLYRQVLGVSLPGLVGMEVAKRPKRVPLVLTAREVAAVLEELERVDGRAGLMASLLYGAGLRLLECLRLRVKDVDLERREIRVREPKGGRERVTMLPAKLVDPLRRQRETAIPARTARRASCARGRRATPRRHIRARDRRRAQPTRRRSAAAVASPTAPAPLSRARARP